MSFEGTVKNCPKGLGEVLCEAFFTDKKGPQERSKLKRGRHQGSRSFGKRLKVGRLKRVALPGVFVEEKELLEGKQWSAKTRGARVFGDSVKGGPQSTWKRRSSVEGMV